MNEQIRETLCEYGFEDALVFDNPDFDEAIIGVTEEGRVIYDYSAMIDSMAARDGISEEEAMEFIEYNTIRSIPYAGAQAPIVAHLFETVPVRANRWTPVEESKPADFVSVLGHMTDAGEFPSVRECYLIDGQHFYFPALGEVHPVDKWMEMPECKTE